MGGIKNKTKNYYKNLRINLSASNNILFTGYYKIFHSPSKNTLSKLISEFSKSKKGDFTVIQVGANDGITHDPIHKFIKRDHWKGVLLEPQKHVFPTLSKIYQKDKNIHTLNAAIGLEDGHASLYKIGFSNARWATGLSSFNKEALLEAFTSGHVARNAKRENISIPDSEEERIIKEEVNVISPKTISKDFELQQIDMLQIDTEGFDFEVIKMFLNSGFKPKLIVFEHSHFSNEDSASCDQFLSNNTYALKKFGGNSAAMLKPLGKFEHLFNQITKES